MEKSDSIVLDPHKTLFLPYGTGAVLVANPQKLYTSFQAGADYMQDAVEDYSELSPADLSPELTKHFRGLRLWLPIKLAGVAPFRAALSEKILLARYFYEQVQRIDGIEVGPFPDLSVVIFRFIPNQGDGNEFNRRLIQAIHDDGRVFISTTQIDGNFTLRIAVSSFRTHLDDIDEFLELLKTKTREIASGY
jgi:glutamate/tyrosine decarboxylase-like PLP-dependent enzyme